MRRKNRLVILLVLVGFCFAATANAVLVITEVMSESGHADVLLGTDWWELTNTGPEPVNMAGYTWDDNHQVPGASVFWGFTIDAGESIIILYSGAPSYWSEFWGLCPDADVYDFFCNFSQLDSADGVFLYDGSNDLVASVEYSSSTVGFSHEWDISGTYLGLSVIGENGAYQSLVVNPDVGSPCYATPEPATVLLLGLGGLALLRKRRI